jgi:hypothetical protein
MQVWTKMILWAAFDSPAIGQAADKILVGSTNAYVEHCVKEDRSLPGRRFSEDDQRKI